MSKGKWMRLLCLLLCMTLILSACAPVEYASYELTPNEYLMGEDGREVYSPSYGGEQLTEEDIQRMNGNKAHLVFSDEGYLTFLNGKFSEEKVEDHEDAVAVLNGVATLLGLSAGSEFFAKYGQKDDDGYTYYVFQQRYGDATVLYATIRVIVDPSGYTAGLSSSFTPNLGIAEEAEPITAEQAADVVRAYYSEHDLIYYPEYTAKVALTYRDGANYNCYAVYTNNPNMTQSFDMPYFEHFVTYGGQFLYNLPVATPNTDSFDAYKAAEYFTGLEAATYSGTVTLYNGSTRQIQVPIAYNPADGLYYLADIERKIMAADYYAFYYNYETLDFITSTNGKDWDNIHLITYANYITAYDFYKDRGITSIDGFGVPILVCMDYRDEDGSLVDNACHFGIRKGWGCFAACGIYPDGMDIIGHEFTHGVTSYSMGGIYYVNETGAINEAYSDIMGNIAEMLTGNTQDQSWLIGEMGAKVYRSMSSPNDYRQPVSLSDPYYAPPTTDPDPNLNDNGGVHVNSSLINSVAYKLYAAGMTLQEEASLWVTSIELITPLSGYEDIYAALLMSLEMNGFDEGYKQVITDAFNDAELLG